MSDRHLHIPSGLTRFPKPQALGLFDGGSPPTRQRRPRSNFVADTQKQVSPYTRRQLLTGSQSLFCNVGGVRGPICERALLSATGGWIPRFAGTDKAWGKRAEDKLWEWMKICDVRGKPYDFWRGLYLASVSIDRDSDIAMLRVKGANGFPQIQWIQAHRIATRNSVDGKVPDGPYRGLKIYDGVIFNEFNRAVAYQVLGDTEDDDRYISARSMLLLYDPLWSDQGRGTFAFEASIIDWMDVQDVQHYDKLGIKRTSSTHLVEHNETGGPDSGETHIKAGTNPVGTGVTVEEVDAAALKYYRANSGGDLKELEANRPSPNVNAYLENIIQGAYQGVGWCIEYSRWLYKMGGAPARIVLEKIDRNVKCRQALLGAVADFQFQYGVSSFIALGTLPANDEWWMWDWMMPKSITADKGYDGKEDRENLKMMTTTLRDICGAQGVWWEDTVDQSLDEQAYIRAGALARGLDPDNVQIRFPNQIIDAAATDGDGSDELNPNEEFKIELDAYGVGVRAGALTPTVEDEKHFRDRMKLPSITSATEKVWGEEKTRRPITLTQADGGRPAPNQNAAEPIEE